MASYRGYGFQYETSPRKLEPDFIPNRTSKKSQDLQRERESV